MDGLPGAQASPVRLEHLCRCVGSLTTDTTLGHLQPDIGGSGGAVGEKGGEVDVIETHCGVGNVT